jgi:hypothetical protein
LYWKRPDSAGLAKLGLRESDVTPPEVDLWPDNWPAVRLFIRYSTQWRAGGGGPIGLDYNPILHDLDRRNLPSDEYEALFDAVRVIETTALEELNRGD